MCAYVWPSTVIWSWRSDDSDIAHDMYDFYLPPNVWIITLSPTTSNTSQCPHVSKRILVRAATCVSATKQTRYGHGWYLNFQIIGCPYDPSMSTTIAKCTSYCPLH